jgi:hypothetical protein
MGKMIVVPVAVDADDVWTEVFGSGWENSEWFKSVEFIDCDDETAGKAKITHYGIDDDNVIEETTITIDDIVDAIHSLSLDGWSHCGTQDLVTDSDYCTSDAILQQAVYGDIIYG